MRHVITPLVSDNFGSGKSTFPDPVRSSVSLWGLPAIQSCPKHLCRPHFPESRTKGAIPGYDLARVSKPIGGQAGIFRRSSVAGTRIRPSRRFYSPAFLSWQGAIWLREEDCGPLHQVPARRIERFPAMHRGAISHNSASPSCQWCRYTNWIAPPTHSSLEAELNLMPCPSSNPTVVVESR